MENIATTLRNLKPGESFSWPFDQMTVVRGIVSYLHKRGEGKFVTEKKEDKIVVLKKS